MNFGLELALVWSSFSSLDPSLQVASKALCRNILPSELIVKLAFLNDDEVKRLKTLLIGN